MVLKNIAKKLIPRAETKSDIIDKCLYKFECDNKYSLTLYCDFPSNKLVSSI